MQYYQPLQKDSDHLWHYTCSNSSGKHVYPVGYCADDCPGHETVAEAIDHYYDYLADKSESYCPDKPSTLTKCDFQSCQEFTANTRQTAGHFIYRFHLCLEHDKRDNYRLLLEGRR